MFGTMGSDNASLRAQGRIRRRRNRALGVAACLAVALALWAVLFLPPESHHTHAEGQPLPPAASPTPADAPTPEPTPEPTLEPTPEPTQEPTPEPTPEPAPPPEIPAGSAWEAAAGAPGDRYIREIRTDKPYVAITVDDGPMGHLGDMLDVLRDTGAKATFFNVGSEIATHPDLLRRIQEEGQELGNHTDTHLSFKKHPAAECLSDILACEDKMKAAGVDGTPWVRPPYGALNPDLYALLSERGYRLVMWTLDTEDWRDKDQDRIVKEALQAEAGDIILIHCHATEGPTLRRIIEGLREKGLEPVTVSTLVASRTP